MTTLQAIRTGGHDRLRRQIDHHLSGDGGTA